MNVIVADFFIFRRYFHDAAQIGFLFSTLVGSIARPFAPPLPYHRYPG